MIIYNLYEKLVAEIGYNQKAINVLNELNENGILDKLALTDTSIINGIKCIVGLDYDKTNCAELIRSEYVMLINTTQLVNEIKNIKTENMIEYVDAIRAIHRKSMRDIKYSKIVYGF